MNSIGETCTPCRRVTVKVNLPSFISKRVHCECGNSVNVFCKDEAGEVETMTAIGWFKILESWVCPRCARKIYENNHRDDTAQSA